jgi:hypothetical protein
MRTKRRATIEELRTAIQALPRTTRIAMLEGIREDRIVVGAYTHGGGICPMLAAHRRGGRTNLISFARAWDRFAFAGARVTRPRPATARELLVLRTHLEASLLEESTPATELAAAIAEHQALVARRQAERPRPGDPHRAHELRSRPGWSWLRPVRRYDEYRWALEQVQAETERPEVAAPAFQG